MSSTGAGIAWRSPARLRPNWRDSRLTIAERSAPAAGQARRWWGGGWRSAGRMVNGRRALCAPLMWPPPATRCPAPVPPPASVARGSPQPAVCRMARHATSSSPWSSGPATVPGSAACADERVGTRWHAQWLSASVAPATCGTWRGRVCGGCVGAWTAAGLKCALSTRKAQHSRCSRAHSGPGSWHPPARSRQVPRGPRCARARPEAMQRLRVGCSCGRSRHASA